MQPSVTERPIASLAGVAWIAMRSPPVHSDGVSGWWAVSASAQQPYGEPGSVNGTLSVIAKSPVGVGRALLPHRGADAAHDPAVAHDSIRRGRQVDADPVRRSCRASCRAASIQRALAVRAARRRSPAASSPRAPTTASTRCALELGLRRPIRATARLRPSGLARSAVRRRTTATRRPGAGSSARRSSSASTRGARARPAGAPVARARSERRPAPIAAPRHARRRRSARRRQTIRRAGGVRRAAGDQRPGGWTAV